MKYTQKKPAIVLLEDGTVFYGKAVGKEGSAFGEICFNTGMTGYQEIFTDPSYFGQIMVAATVHIGNYGAFSEENESDGVKIAGLVCRNFSEYGSRPISEESLGAFLERQNLFVVSDVDTRALVSYIRDHGSMNAVLSTDVDNIEGLKAQLKAQPSMKGLALAPEVSTKEAYFVGDENAPYRVAALDLGIKRNILRNLAARGAYIKVFPHTATFEELSAFAPDGFFLSNGPGDPEPLTEAITLTQQVIDSGKPIFGICLGHQLIALSQGVPTYKMRNGHRGINHPVKNLLTGKSEITSQNHGFAVNKELAEKNSNIEITHLHLNDGTVAGIRLKNRPVFSVQYHPEAAPGPHDASYLFDEFITNIEAYKRK